jgi:hypothetical protein
VRLALDEVKRIWAAFIELNMIAFDRLVGWVEQQGVAKVVKAVSAATLRQRRCRARKAEARKAEDLNPETHDAGGASHASPSVTPGVTEGVTCHVTVTVEEEGEALREREQVLKKGDNSSGRDAPLGEPQQPSENVVRLSDSDAAKKAALKTKLKEERRSKVMRFIVARYTDEECHRRMNGMLGLDPDPMHDEQWWFDRCDEERTRANWDDVSDRRRRA